MIEMFQDLNFTPLINKCIKDCNNKKPTRLQPDQLMGCPQCGKARSGEEPCILTGSTTKAPEFTQQPEVLENPKSVSQLVGLQPKCKDTGSHQNHHCASAMATPPNAMGIADTGGRGESLNSCIAPPTSGGPRCTSGDCW